MEVGRKDFSADENENGMMDLHNDREGAYGAVRSELQ